MAVKADTEQRQVEVQGDAGIIITANFVEIRSVCVDGVKAAFWQVDMVHKVMAEHVDAPALFVGGQATKIVEGEEFRVPERNLALGDGPGHSLECRVWGMAGRETHAEKRIVAEA